MYFICLRYACFLWGFSCFSTDVGLCTALREITPPVFRPSQICVSSFTHERVCNIEKKTEANSFLKKTKIHFYSSPLVAASDITKLHPPTPKKVQREAVTVSLSTSSLMSTVSRLVLSRFACVFKKCRIPQRRSKELKLLHHLPLKCNSTALWANVKIRHIQVIVFEKNKISPFPV